MAVLRNIVCLALLFLPWLITAQVVVENETITNTEATWYGYNVTRTSAIDFTFKNSIIQSQNTVGYLLQAGDETVGAYNNNLDGEKITGNRFLWVGDGTDATVTHGIFTGYNIDAVIRYNYVDRVPMGVVRKSDGMTDTNGSVAYNIFRSPEATAIAIKGMNGVRVYGNTFYSSNVSYTAPGAGTWRGLVDVYENDSPVAASTGVKIMNNIFYTKNQIYNIYVYELSDTVGLECDFNVYYCEAGTPLFNFCGTSMTFAQWQALGYDTHSQVVNPAFIDTVDFVPSEPLFYGTDLGSSFDYGLSVDAVWGSGDPDTTLQGSTWQVGARIYQGDTFYISPTGSDAGAGTLASPWFTINHAWASVDAGDVIYCRGGTYEYNDDQVMSGKSGSAGNYINVWAYPGESPVFTRAAGEFGAVSWPVALLKVSGANYIYLKDLRITGFEQDTALSSICSGLTLYNSDNCIIERVESDHNGHGILVYACGDPQILYCDTHHNYDPIDPYGSDPYGDGDGLEVTDMGEGTETIIRGHRSWNNSDDGIDLWDSGKKVSIDSCWTWHNGYREDGTTTGGDGNGIKLGRLYSGASAYSDTLRIVTNNVSFRNRGAGFNQNATYTIILIRNNTSYGNGGYGYFLFNMGTAVNQSNNNISYDNTLGNGTWNAESVLSHNTFLINGNNNTSYVVNSTDFASIDSTGVSGSRTGNNKPVLSFLHLAVGSDLIDTGVDVGISFIGDGPDLGAYEHELPLSPGITSALKSPSGIMLKTLSGKPIKKQ
jgi:hypothetical protein